MKRSSWDGDTVVYRYGIIDELPDVLVDQMRLAHRLKNDLVEIERVNDSERLAAEAEFAEIAEADAAVADASAAVDVLVAQAKAERVADRSTRPRAETKVALKETRQVLREARAARKAVRERLYPTMKPRLQQVRDTRRARIKDLYRTFVQEQGLYWATYNDVVSHHETAAQRVITARQAGQPANHRFQRWDGTGSVAVQLQRQANDPARTPLLLASGEGRWRNVLQVSPWVHPEEFNALPRREQRQIGRTGLIRFSVGSGQAVTLRTIVHRMLPPDADITMARITVTRVGSKTRAGISLTARVAKAVPRDVGARTAVHFGWRANSDRSLRVATVKSTGAMPAIPTGLRDVVTQVPGGYEVRVPASWRDVDDRVDSLRSRRDSNLDLLRPALAEYLNAEPLPETETSPLVTGTDVQRWRSPARFAVLARRLREERPGDEITATIEAWRKQDKHLWEWEANERDQVIARRRDAWRNVASWLSKSAALLVLDASSISGLARTPDVGEEDVEQARKARSNRTIAAPGELRSLIETTANREGVTLEHIAPVSRIHYPCGTELDPTELQARINVWCSTCQQTLDQDVNTCDHLLGAATSAA